MHRRCKEKRNKNYVKYGAEGVRVCRRWESFLNFLEDMGKRPRGSTLGRFLDVGNYTPSNCKWMTRAEQGAEKTKKNNARSLCKRGHKRVLSNVVKEYHNRCRLCHNEDAARSRARCSIV